MNRLVFPPPRARPGVGGLVSPAEELPEVFTGGAFITGVAGEFPHVQLFLPAVGGVKLRVRYIGATAGASSNIRIAAYDTPLTTLSRRGTSGQLRPESSLAELRVQTNATGLGTVINERGVTAQSPIVFIYDRIIELLPGRGILARIDSPAQSLSADYEWEEVPW